MARNERKSRHKALLKEVSALINQPVDSLAVRLVALARLKMDGVEAQLLSGDPSITVADITTLQGIFSAHVPKPGLAIRVTYVDGADTAPPDSAAVDGLIECRRCHWRPFDRDRVERCYRCGWRHGDDVSAPWQPVIATADTSKGISPGSPENLSTSSPAPGNVVPLDGKRAAELRAAARVSNGVDPGPPRNVSPCIGTPFSGGDNRSVSQFMRDVDNAYR
jgi:hypothetical protein